MLCTNPWKFYPPRCLDFDKKYPEGFIWIPCGKCIGCRIARTKEWTLRLLHELEVWDDACFVTLTYDDEHLPKNRTLVKRHLQLFIKRLRRKRSPLKYYAVGEYGERTGRPHYHLILFGLSPTDAYTLLYNPYPREEGAKPETEAMADVRVSSEDEVSEDELIARTSSQAGRLWSYGYTFRKSIGTVTSDSISYVCKYVDKVYYGELKEEVYTSTGRIGPFAFMSNKLGYDMMIKDSERFKQNLSTTFRGVTFSLPRYYKRKLLIDSQRFADLSIKKKIKEIKRALSRGMSLDDYYDELKKINIQKNLNFKAQAHLKHERKKSNID